MRKKIIFGFIFVTIFSLAVISADLISPAQLLGMPLAIGAVIGIIILISWLITKSIKKKNVPKPNK